MNENTLLEMSNQMKEIVDRKDKELKNMSEKYMDLKKVIGNIYGLSRTMHNNFETDINMDGLILGYLIHEIRRLASDTLFGEEEAELEIDIY